MRYLYFSSESCGPCKIIMPKIMRHPEIAVIDVETNNEYVMKYGVMSIPTLIGLNGDDTPEFQITGSKINKWLKENFKE